MNPWHMGTHLRALSESYSIPLNTVVTGFRLLNLCVLGLWTKVASALEGLNSTKLMLHSKVIFLSMSGLDCNHLIGRNWP